jgi:hypothetical protein
VVADSASSFYDTKIDKKYIIPKFIEPKFEHALPYSGALPSFPTTTGTTTAAAAITKTEAEKEWNAWTWLWMK